MKLNKRSMGLSKMTGKSAPEPKPRPLSRPKSQHVDDLSGINPGVWYRADQFEDLVENYSDNFLVRIKSGVMYLACRCIIKGQRVWWVDDGYDGFVLREPDSVTHWMMIPESPV